MYFPLECKNHYTDVSITSLNIVGSYKTGYLKVFAQMFMMNL